jgi:hypothetical protein
MAAEGELMDVVLGDRWPAWRVREALIAHLPPGWRLVDLFDVWLAGPALAGQVAAADYRIELAADADAASLQRACAELLARPQLLRERPKGGGTVTYDLRPLLIDVSVREPGPPPVIVTRTRFHPELGMGRPEEVVAALGSATGVALVVGSITRQQLILSEDLARPS